MSSYPAEIMSLEGFQIRRLEDSGYLIRMDPEFFHRSEEIINGARNILGIPEYWNIFD